MGDAIELVLYVDGGTSRSLSAEQNLNELCRANLSNYRIEVVDVAAIPSTAVSEQLVALPTLKITRDGRVQRIIGDLTIAAPVITALGMGQYARQMRADAEAMMEKIRQSTERNRQRIASPDTGIRPGGLRPPKPAGDT
jgi:hypothetical protein